MLDNDTGGRCICSNRNAELDDILAEIEKLDQQSYQMATAGVERIEMGADADAAIASANAAAQSVMKAEQASGSKRRTLDLSMWDTFTFDDDEDIFGEGNTLQSVIDGKQGDALHRAAAELCVAQMPECANEISMLQMMYAQKIKNDCSAYENSLKQQKNSSAQKLAAAEKALREAALDQLRTANKYDLGQCTVEFKKCMASTGGCGDDFKGCVGIAASEQIKGQTPKQVSITGSKTKITIAASTYDTLEAKKPMCMSVTNSCVAVADQVWDTFMREVAPQLKTAELLAESDLRTSCISNISDCFQKACKDTIDPNDPDGSYDMCLSRPETVKSLCKVQIDPCVAAEPLILDFVYARLAAMRVDACTNDVKNCLQDDDRCGKDYTQCVGLDLASIKDMCPLEKLVGCQKNGELNSIDELDNILQGIYLGIDNALLQQCQDAVTEQMIELCGDTMTCPIFDQDIAIGKGSIAMHQEGNGDNVLDGLIAFSNIKISKDTPNGIYNINVADYMQTIPNADNASRTRIQNTLEGIANEVKRRIDIMVQNPQLSMCVNGRDISQIRGSKTPREKQEITQARFPNLLNAYTNVIATAALEAAKNNYDQEYAQMISMATAESSQYKNQIYCTAMAQRENYSASRAPDSGIKEISNWRVVLNGATTEEMLQVLGENTERTDILTDTSNRMIAKKITSSVYDPSGHVCRITTTTYPCTGFEAIYNSKSSSKSGSGGVSFLGIGASAGGATSSSSTTYQGNFCNSFSEPVISEQLINMNPENGTVYNMTTTRSNLQNYYNDQSSVSNITEKSGGGFSLGISTGNISNIGSGNTKNTSNINSNNKTTNNTNSNNKTTNNSNTKK